MMLSTRRIIPAATVMLLTIVVANARAQDLFPDKNLEAAVRQQVFAKRNNAEPLTADDVKSVSTIVAKNKGIKNLTGLEACRALALLDLEGNEIADVGPLRELTMVQSLNLASNNIQDVSPLAALTGLQYLHLADNQIANVAPLAKLTKLTSLYLSDNKLKEIKPLAELKKLWSLYIDGNEVNDLTPVAGLTQLSTLDAGGCAISDLTPLKPLGQWQFLMLQDNQITDLGPLVEMAEKDAAGEMRFAPFWRIYLGGNPLSEAAKTGQIEQLKKLGGRVFT